MIGGEVIAVLANEQNRLHHDYFYPLRDGKEVHVDWLTIREGDDGLCFARIKTAEHGIEAMQMRPKGTVSLGG